MRVRGDGKQIFAGLRIMGLTLGVMHFKDSWLPVERLGWEAVRTGEKANRR